MIRLATPEDVEGIGELLIHGRAESPTYRDVPYSATRAKAFLHSFINQAERIVLVDDNNGVIDGVLVGDIQPDWTTLGWTAYAHLTYARRGSNGYFLLKFFINWAKSWKKVKKIHIPTSFSGERGEAAGKLLERLGFKSVGQQYVEVL